MRVLIADDHPMFRVGLRLVLDSDPRTDLIGEATNGQEAVDLARELRPDVVVMDLHLPDMSGIEATRRILDENAAQAVLVLTMSTEDDAVLAALRAGSRGYLLKESGPREIISAVLAVGEGACVFDPEIATRLVETRRGTISPPHPAFPELTSREREILNLIAAGQSNGAIALHLVLSPKTVRNHISNIFAKLQVEGRSQAIVRARQAGLGSI